MTEPTSDSTFLADPARIADWRHVILLETATETGLLAALPGTAEDIVARTGGDLRGTRIVLDALSVYEVTVQADDGTFALGPGAPTPGEAAVLHQHAGVIARWSSVLQDRVRGDPAPAPTPTPATRGPREPGELQRWLTSLGTMAAQRAPGVVDACLEAVPGARTVLELGGGHGEFGREFARRGCAVTMQDRAPVIDLARERGVLEAEGIDLYAGDFFEDVADGPFDVVFLAGVAHTYPESGIRMLYEQIRPVTDRALVISTRLRGEDDRFRLFAVQMLSGGNGGDTYDVDQHREWLRTAGFTSTTDHEATNGTRLLVATT